MRNSGCWFPYPLSLSRSSGSISTSELTSRRS
jgi:hypothetical protein